MTEVLNRWQKVWRSVDEARLMVRLMLIAKFAALVFYVFYGTVHFHAVVNGALVLVAAQQTTFAELVPVLAAVTAFYGVTFPILSKMYLEAWKDYRQSGTDWQNVEARAEVGAVEAAKPSGGQS